MPEHFPHSGTQQMDGLMTPAVAQAAAQGHEFPAGSVPLQNGMPQVPLQNGMPQVPLQPTQPMANLVTSGFEAPVHQRSGSGSQVGLHILTPLVTCFSLVTWVGTCALLKH